MKTRDFELRIIDTPQLITDTQMDRLTVMAKADDVAELHEFIFEGIDVLLSSGDMPMEYCMEHVIYCIGSIFYLNRVRVLFAAH
jgi:hypothetical protein